MSRPVRFSGIALRCYACPRKVFHGQVLRHESVGNLDNTTIEATCYHKHRTRARATGCSKTSAASLRSVTV